LVKTKGERVPARLRFQHSSSPHLPIFRHSHVSVIWDKHLFVFGGIISFPCSSHSHFRNWS